MVANLWDFEIYKWENLANYGILHSVTASPCHKYWEFVGFLHISVLSENCFMFLYEFILKHFWNYFFEPGISKFCCYLKLDNSESYISVWSISINIFYSISSVENIKFL